MSGQRDDRPLAHGALKWTGCLETGKRGYASRADAKRAIRRGQLQGGGLQPFPCPHGEHFHVGHSNGLTRADHEAFHAGVTGRGPADPAWLTVAEVTRRLKPRHPARMRALIERMALEGRVVAVAALGVTLIHADEVPRLHRAAWDRSQDKRLRGL